MRINNPNTNYPTRPGGYYPYYKVGAACAQRKKGKRKIFSLHFYAVFTHRLTFFISLEIFVAQSNDSIERSLNVMTVKNGRV